MTPPGLIVEPNLSDGDGFYEALIETHQGLDADQSNLVNAKLILLLANHIGELNVLLQAMAYARSTVGKPGPVSPQPPRAAP